MTAYNPEMGPNQPLTYPDGHRQDEIIVTAAERAARAIAASYNRARRDEGRTAWASPQVLDWRRFAQTEWERRRPDSRLVLNPLQELALWTDILANSHHPGTVLPESRRRLAALAVEAHGLICSHAPALLDPRLRKGWTRDPAAFSAWLEAFEQVCREKNVISAARVPLELRTLLQADSGNRPPLKLAGFDRLLPIHRELFEAWGAWEMLPPGHQPAETAFYATRDTESELAACAAWCGQRLASEPKTRILVLTQDAAKRRGEIERAFLAQNQVAGHPVDFRFEFSLGVPLRSVAVSRSAILLLHWLGGALPEHELDWLIAIGHSAKTPQETESLQAHMRSLRRNNLQRPQWSLQSFLNQRQSTSLPRAWIDRLVTAQRQLDLESKRAQSPVRWAEFAVQLLNTIGWPGPSLGSSQEFQAARRFRQVLDTCGSLGFDGRNLSWNDFLEEFDHALRETLFAPESEDPPILIAGPAESAGLTADAIWFLGAGQDAWPARGSLHPLLPASVQRSAQMPHASPQADWELANAITRRLLLSAREVCFSHPLQMDGTDTVPSRLIVQLAGVPVPVPHELAPPAPLPPVTIAIEDRSTAPCTISEETVKFSGGSTLLTTQSQCPFKAFATVRLQAQSWQLAETGLTPAMRGQLLHSVLHAIWAGPPQGISTLNDLLGLNDRRAFVSQHVQQVIASEVPQSVRQIMPERYLELEEQRLTRLVFEWLDYEGTRLPFTVLARERDSNVTIAGLSLKLRLDRIDRLNNGSLLVVDYKTGDVSPKSWDLPRPDDVQLPLYGGFALGGEELGGLVFAKIRAGDVCFTGRVGAPAETLGNLKNIKSLQKNELTAEILIDWRDAIEQLARDFIAGRAEVNPRDPALTCARCDLHTLCRIHEQEVSLEELAEADDE